jgi:hypothetical protein
MYGKFFGTHAFFCSRLRSRNRFLGWIGMRLKLTSAHAGAVIYTQGNDMSHLYLLDKGTCAFASPKHDNAIFGVVDGKRKEALKYFGLEDMIINHALLIMDIHNNNFDSSTLD